MADQGIHPALAHLGGGQTLDDLLEAIVKVAEAVIETGKKGGVTLTLSIQTREQGDPRIIVAEEIAMKMPKRAPRGQMLWAIGGELHRDDPRQARIPFRDFDPGTGEVREPMPLPVAQRAARGEASNG